MLTAHGVADRVTVTGGSFFESVPAADAYVMKNVIHDWPDDTAIAILGTIKAAAPPGATLLLLEMVVPDHDREFLGHYADMEMLVMAGALERSLTQWTDPTPAGRLPTAARGADGRPALRHRSRAQLAVCHASSTSRRLGGHR